MKAFDWNRDKNEWLRKVRQVSFEEIVFHIKAGDLLDVIEHHDPDKYPGQRILVVNLEGYVCIVPFIESEDTFFLKTVIPSQKMTKRYLGTQKHETN